jgi:hypothetical protein
VKALNKNKYFLLIDLITLWVENNQEPSKYYDILKDTQFKEICIFYMNKNYEGAGDKIMDMIKTYRPKEDTSWWTKGT